MACDGDDCVGSPMAALSCDLESVDELRAPSSGVNVIL